MTTPNPSETPPASTDGTPPEGTPPATPPAGTEGTPPAPVDGDQASIDALPKWARDALTKANGEAANYRTRLRDAEEKLSNAKTPEEVEAAVAEVKQKNAELERSIMVSNVALKHELPPQLASRLTGDTAEDLEKDALELKKLIVARAPDSLSGGLTPDDGSPTETDPRKLAQKHGGRRR